MTQTPCSLYLAVGHAAQTVAQTASRYQNKLLSMLPCFDISVPRLNVPVVLTDLQGEPDLHDKTLCMQQ
jgi:hypothetical protein